MLKIQPGPPDSLSEEKDGSRFRRHSIFEQATAESLPAGGPEPQGPPDWLEGARTDAAEQGQFLAFSEHGEHEVVAIAEGWTGIGRSAAADLRLDDPSVSRRHALIVNSEERGLRVLDDRSLNGVYVNGERADWSVLEDGDELQIGRFRLFVIDSDFAQTG